MTSRRSLPFPDGITDQNLGPRRGAFLKSWLPLPFLGGILVLSFTGVFGGAPAGTQSAYGKTASLTVRTANVLRNGQIFEMQFDVAARQDVAKPVIAVDAAYLRSLTLNTLRPEPASQSYEKGAILLEYDPLRAGHDLRVTIEGQVNPVLGQWSAGTAQFRDGDVILAEVPLRLRVLP